jgi:hypothetical protein
LLTAVLVAVVLGISGQAQASQNSGWIYTVGGSGAVYFDADLNGYPYYEKITVCDNKSDGRGIYAVVSGYQYDSASSWHDVSLRDPSNDGNCAALWDDYFWEEYTVYITVCEYAGTELYNCARSTAIG